MDVMFCTAQDGTVLMFPTFLQIIHDFYRSLITIHSCAMSELTEVQMHEVDLLFE